MAFASKKQLEVIERAELRKWLVFTNAGGITGLNAVLTDGESSSLDLVRSYFLCDSDALLPGVPSSQAASVRRSLDERSRSVGLSSSELGYVLERRFAESYAPIHEVLTWAKERASPKDADAIFKQWQTVRGRKALADVSRRADDWGRRLLVALALRDVSDDQRNHFNWKSGLRGAAHDATLFNGLEDSFETVLQQGLGSRFSAWFFPARKGTLVDSSGELASALAEIVRRL